MQKKNYVQEILDIIHSGLPQAELAEKLSDYHENDLADALTALTPEERQKVYTALGVDTVAEIFSYLDDAEPYLKELDPERAARVISHMDSDDAVDALDDLEEDDKAKIVHQLDKDAADDVKLLLSYHEDEIGSCMTTNYICIRRDMTIRQAMSELVKQAGENDNISTLYVVDENEHFYGAIDLKQDEHGDYYFLEVNPAGQWQFVESRAGLPITQAHADALRRMASAQRRRRGKTARSTQDHATP